MGYITVTLQHHSSGREVEFTVLASNVREALLVARREYPADDYGYVKQ